MPATKHSWLWGRLLVLSVTGAALYLISRRLSLETLAQTFQRMHWGWFVGAVALYGVLFIPAAFRWHLVLRLTDHAVHPRATARLTLIGHFFYTMLLGVFGGDTAKSAVYARWYRLPLIDILATASLDRLLGSAGMLIFSSLMLFVALFAGAFKRVQGISLHLPHVWGIGLVVLIAAIIIVSRWLPSVASAWRRFVVAFRCGAKILLISPSTVAAGVFCSVLMQVMLSAALAFNLRAATNGSLPWEQLIWTFPVVVAISALPLTFSGLGARDGAALTLFGLYGVSHEDAVGASLLTVATSLFWTLAGGILYWHERRCHRQFTPTPTTNLSSLIRRTREPSPATRG